MDTTDRLGRARDRLDRALDRLDRALAAAPVDDGTARELRRVQAENARLRETTHTVSRRLDITIGRLKSVLEG